MNGFLGARFFLGSLTRVGNAPFRRLAVEMGAEGTIGEMVLADRLVRGGRRDAALIDHHPEETLFGAQLAGKREADLAEGARMAEERGARFVDLNCACPIRSLTQFGAGAALARRPARVARAVAAVAAAVRIPVTVKLRSGWQAGQPNALEVARAAVDAGAAAVFIHGRSCESRYRGPADWQIVSELAAALSVPVIGSGDLAHGPDVAARMAESGCAAVAIARGAVVKPWIFREAASGALSDPSSRERLAIFARLVALSLEHFGDDARGRRTAAQFLHLQLDFLSRYVPVGAIGRPVPLQERVASWQPRDELEALMGRRDGPAWHELLELAGLKLEEPWENQVPEPEE